LINRRQEGSSGHNGAAASLVARSLFESRFHPPEGREPCDRPRRAQALSFDYNEVVSFAPASPSGVRAKIVSRREAPPCAGNDNGVVRMLNLDRLFATIPRPLSRRAEIALIVLFALVAAQLASHDRTQAPFPARNTEIVFGLLLIALIASRRWPSLAAGAATLASAIAIVATQGATLSAVSFCAALFLLAQLVIRRSLLFASPLLVPFIVLTLERLKVHHPALMSTAPLLFLVAALAVAESMRRRRLAVAALDASEEAMAESLRARTVMEERARIARELHDIVAHHLSVITVESEAARLTLPELSADAASRFEAIAATAREALTDTRRLLGVLRENTPVEAERAPQPGLGELEDLIDKAQASGARIHLTRQGAIDRLPRTIDLAAYRIVQEALTNARRHAPGADVDVEILNHDHALHLRIRDHGPGPLNGDPLAGHGLMGMRERTTLAGGTFSAGRAEGGGFEVDVTLPTAPAAT
jgi:signal transduction histidine kinase